MFLVAFSIFSAVILFAVAKVRQLIRIGKEMQGAGQNLKTQTSDTQQLTTKEPERGDCHHFLVLIFSHLLPTLHLFFEKFFPALAPSVTQFDFIEEDNSDWKFFGIKVKK